MHILHIDCSPRASSHSRRLSAALLERLLNKFPDATIIRRDLGQHPIPHPLPDYAAALASPKAMANASASTWLSEELIQEVEAADRLVIGTPMNNFTVPSVLKAWIDQILRVGRTIGMNADGEKVGLLQDKPVYIGIASGGTFWGENARQPDFLTPYLRAAFACVGLQSLQFFPLQATAFLDDQRLAEDRSALIAAMNLSAI